MDEYEIPYLGLGKPRSSKERADTLDRRAAMSAHHSRMRQAMKKQRVPPWVDKEAIAAIYKEARRVSMVTGVPHHVDHVIPLAGKFVSGLHVHTNLAIVPAAVNLKKYNRAAECEDPLATLGFVGKFRYMKRASSSKS